MKIVSILSALVIMATLSGCETTQSKEDGLVEIVYVPAVPYCTKLPLMADLTKSYQNRVYIEDGKPCTKDRRAY